MLPSICIFSKSVNTVMSCGKEPFLVEYQHRLSNKTCTFRWQNNSTWFGKRELWKNKISEKEKENRFETCITFKIYDTPLELTDMASVLIGLCYVLGLRNPTWNFPEWGASSILESLLTFFVLCDVSRNTTFRNHLHKVSVNLMLRSVWYN